MKRLLFLLGLWAMILPLAAQNLVTVNGTVVDSVTGTPVIHHEVIIHSDSMHSNGGPFFHVVFTDQQGHYSDNIPLGPGISNGSIVVSTRDCTPLPQVVVLNFGPGNYSLHQDFAICNGSPAGCHAHFIFEKAGPFTFQFTNTSEGGGGISHWNFGDGTSSTATNPTHTFPAPGPYNVELTIGFPDSACSDQFSAIVQVCDSVPPANCHAFFQAHQDSVQALQINFNNLSTGNFNTFVWNFGDGSSSTIGMPGNPNIIHQYSQEGLYLVCLTAQGVDSSCVSTFCDSVFVHNTINQECKAEFRFNHDPGSPPAALHFIDMSHSQGPVSWNWNFGDGTFSNERNPIHEFAQMGFYNVCLTISGTDSACFDTECRQVKVGEPAHCEAQFTFYPDSIPGSNGIHFVDLSYGNPTIWHWDFGDSTFSTEQNPTHTYASPGHYHVCLEINSAQNDSVMCHSTWCREVEIGNHPHCINYFTYQNAGLSVSFEGHMLNGNASTYTWDFGDAQTGEGQNVVHDYSTGGIYFATLTTEDSTGCRSVSSQSIVVGDSSLWNQLYGQVFEGAFPAHGGLVMLFSIDTTNSFVPFFDISPVNPQGVYFFPMVPKGDFIIYAIPFNLEYVPTYYGDVLNWQAASVISLGIANNPYDIHLLTADSFIQGAGSIAGQVSQGNIKASMVARVTMLLKDNNGKTIAYSQVNEAGNFVFPQLTYGTYYLYAELAGCVSENIKVEITPENPSVQIMMTLDGNNILSVAKNNPSIESIAIYPVPVKDVANITVTLPKSNELTIELFNMAGQKVYHNVKAFASGQSTLTIPFENLMNGIYQLSIISQDGVRLNRKLVKTN